MTQCVLFLQSFCYFVVVVVVVVTTERYCCSVDCYLLLRYDDVFVHRRVFFMYREFMPEAILSSHDEALFNFVWIPYA